LQASGDHRHQEKVRVCDFDNLFTLYANLDCRRYKCFLYLDEAHSIGAMGTTPCPSHPSILNVPIYLVSVYIICLHICVCVFMDLFVLCTYSMTTEQELPAAASASIATLTLLISTS
jgi:hypothetical protein